MWDQPIGVAPLVLDDEGRVRLDAFDLTGDIQAAVAERQESATTETIADLADLDRFRAEARRPYGFRESPQGPRLSPSEFPALPTGSLPDGFDAVTSDVGLPGIAGQRVLAPVVLLAAYFGIAVSTAAGRVDVSGRKRSKPLSSEACAREDDLHATEGLTSA
ncbi:hypothetical protein ACQ86F_36975 [Streptomyces venezuelae ATCC 10712]